MAVSSPRSRDYFITINKGAKCYEHAFEILLQLNYRIYAMIKHDKDQTMELDNNTGELVYKPKKEHLHIVVELKNAITFTSISDKFEGAHIEQIKYKKACYQYLLHNRPNSLEKYQYDFSDISSNNLEAVQLAIDSENGLRLFNENMFLHYMAEGILDKYSFVKAFGLNVYKQYWHAYEDMIKLSAHSLEMQKDINKIKEDLQNELPF